MIELCRGLAKLTVSSRMVVGRDAVQQGFCTFRAEAVIIMAM